MDEQAERVEAEEIAAKTINNTLGTLVVCLNAAVEDGVIAEAGKRGRGGLREGRRGKAGAGTTSRPQGGSPPSGARARRAAGSVLAVRSARRLPYDNSRL